MTKNWGENITCKFVECYVEQNVLWNKTLPEYKIREARQRVYENIAKEMASLNIILDVYQIKSKIKSLQNTYKQEKRKISKSKCSGTATSLIYKSQLKWFEMMSDTDSGTLDRETVTNVESDHDIEDTSSFSDTISTSDVCNSAENQINLPKKAPKRKSNIANITNAIDKLQKLSDTVIATDKDCDEDEFQTFGKYVGCQLKKLSLQSALEAKQQFMAIMTSLRIKELGQSDSSKLNQPKPRFPILYSKKPNALNSINLNESEPSDVDTINTSLTTQPNYSEGSQFMYSSTSSTMSTPKLELKNKNSRIPSFTRPEDFIISDEEDEW